MSSTFDLAEVSDGLSRDSGHYFAQACNTATDLFAAFPKFEPTDADRDIFWIGDSLPEANEVGENDPYNAPSYGTKKQAYVESCIVQSSLAITGKVRDALKKRQDWEIGNWMGEVSVQHTRALIQKTNALMAGGLSSKGFQGLELLIDNTGTASNVNRAVVTKAASYVNENGGTPRTLTQAMLDVVNYQLRTVREGQFNVIFCAENIAKDWEDLDTSRARPVVQLQQTGPTFQVSAGAGSTMAGDRGLNYLGVKIVPLIGYSDDRMDFLYLDDEGTSWRIIVFREIEVSAPQAINDGHVIHYTYGANLECRNPRRHSATIRDLS